MRDFEEYEFVLPDGSRRYEIVDLTQPVFQQVSAFKRLHGAVSGTPIRLVAEIEQRRLERHKIVKNQNKPS